VLVYGGAKEDIDSILLMHMTSSNASCLNGSGSIGGSTSNCTISSKGTTRLFHELPLPKSPDDSRPEVVRRTVRDLQHPHVLVFLVLLTSIMNFLCATS
jgi:hypothetical protein